MIYALTGVTFAYRAGEPVLQDVDLSIAAGELWCVLGCNGAGKSTLFGCMTGRLQPQSGSVRLEGADIKTMKEREIACRVGYVPQSHAPAFAYSVFDYVLMGCAPHIGLFSAPGEADRQAAREALDRLRIAHLAGRPYTEISGGEQQQAAIARAIVANPKIILFDEPTSHLDVGNQIKVLRIIKELSQDGYAIVVTTHDPNHALMLDGNAAVFGCDGRVRSGRCEEMLTEQMLQEVYGAKMELLELPNRKVCVYPPL